VGEVTAASTAAAVAVASATAAAAAAVSLGTTGLNSSLLSKASSYAATNERKEQKKEEVVINDSQATMNNAPAMNDIAAMSDAATALISLYPNPEVRLGCLSGGGGGDKMKPRAGVRAPGSQVGERLYKSERHVSLSGRHRTKETQRLSDEDTLLWVDADRNCGGWGGWGDQEGEIVTARKSLEVEVQMSGGGSGQGGVGVGRAGSGAWAARANFGTCFGSCRSATSSPSPTPIFHRMRDVEAEVLDEAGSQLLEESTTYDAAAIQAEGAVADISEVGFYSTVAARAKERRSQTRVAAPSSVLFDQLDKVAAAEKVGAVKAGDKHQRSEKHAGTPRALPLDQLDDMLAKSLAPPSSIPHEKSLCLAPSTSMVRREERHLERVPFKPLIVAKKTVLILSSSLAARSMTLPGSLSTTRTSEDHSGPSANSSSDRAHDDPGGCGDPKGEGGSADGNGSDVASGGSAKSRMESDFVDERRRESGKGQDKRGGADKGRREIGEGVGKEGSQEELQMDGQNSKQNSTPEIGEATIHSSEGSKNIAIVERNETKMQSSEGIVWDERGERPSTENRTPKTGKGRVSSKNNEGVKSTAGRRGKGWRKGMVAKMKPAGSQGWGNAILSSPFRRKNTFSPTPLTVRNKIRNTIKFQKDSQDACATSKRIGLRKLRGGRVHTSCCVSKGAGGVTVEEGGVSPVATCCRKQWETSALGASAEDASLASSNKQPQNKESSTNLRSVVAKGSNKEVIGRRVEVFWEQEGTWFPGKILNERVIWQASKRLVTHHVGYEDGSDEWHHLESQTKNPLSVDFRLLDGKDQRRKRCKTKHKVEPYGSLHGSGESGGCLAAQKRESVGGEASGSTKESNGKITNVHVGGAKRGKLEKKVFTHAQPLLPSDPPNPKPGVQKATNEETGSGKGGRGVSTQGRGSRKKGIGAMHKCRFEQSMCTSGRLKAGDWVMCEDRGDFWRSEIKAVDFSVRIQRVFVHFHGWSSRHDVWLPVTSSRNAPPPHTHTPGIFVENAFPVPCCTTHTRAYSSRTEHTVIRTSTW